jgi:DNA primase
LADERDEIRSRIDLVDLVSRHGIVLKRSGKNWTGLCPFHPDKNPSFNVSQGTQRYKCWSCNEGGDIFNWVMKTQNVDFVEALQILAKQAGVELKGRKQENAGQKQTQLAAMEEALAFFRTALEKSSEAKAYCDNRGLDAAVREKWEIGYAPDIGEALATHLKKKGFSLAECKSLFLVDQDPSGGYFDKFRGRIMFATRDERGQLVAYGGRVPGDGLPKYINSGDTPLYRKSKVLYGLYQAKEFVGKARKAVLVEGYIDVVACHRAGVQTAVASLGTSMSEDHAKLLKRWCEEVTILYDSDDAGQKAASRASEMLQAEGLRVRVALMPKGEDPDTLLRTAGAGAVQKAVEGGISPLDYKIQSIRHKLSPDAEEFWPEVAAALATAANPIEFDKHLVTLAGLYPGTKDPIQAQKSIRGMVAQFKRGHQSPTNGGSAPYKAVATSKPQLLAAESVIFKSLLGLEFRTRAWEALQEDDLLVTQTAMELAAAIQGVFIDGPPTEPPSQWLSQIEPESLREVLTFIDFQDHLIVSDKFLEDSVNDLRKRRSKRELQHLKGGELDNKQLEEITARLRKLKGVQPGETQTS